jgi:hypothetical protein
MIFLLLEFQPGSLQQGELREVLHRRLLHPPQHQGTMIKKKIKFSSYEIQNGAVAKSYMTKGLLIYGDIFAHFLIYWEALPHFLLRNCSTLNFPIY